MQLHWGKREAGLSCMKQRVSWTKHQSWRECTDGGRHEALPWRRWRDDLSWGYRPCSTPDLSAVLTPQPPAPKHAVWTCSLPEGRPASKVTVVTMEPEQWDHRVLGHVPPTVYGPRTTIELRFWASELLQE